LKEDEDQEDQNMDESDVEWPEITNLNLNAGKLNLKEQTGAVRTLINDAMDTITNYIALKYAYPDLTRKGDAMKEALLLAARRKLPEAENRIENSPQYVATISTTVRFLCTLGFCYLCL
jgi:hypothetical protein